VADEAFTEEFEEGEQPELFTPIEQVAGVWTN